ncbi:MAG: CheR family methyltransferase [Thermoanaerobaculales bacterium]
MHDPVPDPITLRAVELMSDRCGIVVPPYRFPVLRAQLERLGGRNGAAQGLARLDRGDEDAWAGLITVTAIPETYFFRHPGHFKLISRKGFERAMAGRVFRVLCAGCSTGEEVWSAAAVLAALPAGSAGRHQVTGWDLSRHRLRTASLGRYRSWSCRKGFYSYERFFEKIGTEWQVASVLRPFARFSQVNLIDPEMPADRFDAILFRNVSIYWDQTTIDAVTAQLTRRLVEDGLFLVGPGDPVSLDSAEWQQRFEDGSRVYQRYQPDEHEVLTPDWPAPAERQTVVQSRLEAGISRPCRPERAGRGIASSRPVREPGHTRHTPLPAEGLSADMARRESPTLVVANGPFGEVGSLADAGEYQQALEALSRSETRTSPQRALWEGILLLNLGREKEAVSCLRRCVFLEPNEPSFRRWLAVAFEATGRTAEAARENRNATELEEQ